MNNELIKKDLYDQEFYIELVSECKAILSEAHFAVQAELLKGKWEIGRRIVQDELEFQRAGYGEKVVEILSVALEISPQTLWKCIQFYKRFSEKEFDTVIQKIQIDGKTPSWYKVCREVLPVHIKHNIALECEHDNLICLKCRKRFTMRELNNNGG